MASFIPQPRRPETRSSRANSVLDWVDVCFYIFWSIFAAVMAVVGLLQGWDLVTILRLPL